MNVTHDVRTNWNTHLVATFGMDAPFVGQELPAFEAYVVDGTLRVFAGRVSETRLAVLTKALEMYSGTVDYAIAA